MFSSLSNFLPSSLHTPNKSPIPAIRQDEDDEDDDPGNKSDANADDPGLFKKKKDKNPNETFIFVRPPPAKSNHPLNLQVQLIPPNTRGPSGLTSASRQSLDLGGSEPSSVADASPRSSYDAGTSLSRSPSNRSIASSTLSSASTTSLSSTASSRRMIVPLYNLQAHNVMTNTIVDAGTDAKIARFSKRGIEMLELAIMEPIEVYSDAGARGAGSVISARTVGHKPSFMSNSGGLLPPGHSAHRSSSRPSTPELPSSSQASLVSSSAHSQASSAMPGPISDTPTPTAQKRHIFGKLFKRKEGSDKDDGSATPTRRSRTRSVSPSPGVTVSNTPVAIAPIRPSIDLAYDDSPSSQQIQAARAPVLGVVPILSAPVHPPKGRPGLYVWVVRKWLKVEGSGLLSMAKGMVKGQYGHETDIVSEVEVRFEWKRGKPKKRVNKEKNPAGEASGARQQTSTFNKDSIGSSASKRLSLNVISRQSSFSTTAASEDGHAVRDSSERRQSLALNQDDRPEDSGDESDPEDSETPWTCTLKVRRTGRSPSNANTELPRKEKEGLRIKVGTLSPTPHHPKVVGMLKVPFPLPDVDVELLAVRKREAGQGSLSAALKPGQGLLLTAEEIKDVICSTGLWLVVRESFGGVGKVSRKGDGWRIRG
ncbi:unnamed protein product [Mycena citricolor]|uniref:Uncharacterized protein n=1 Tax=Mycena citricolor TaxID=2018698 RepID=A0AAD2K3V5_9AGAR|nr:unnamed protein product [Mycena citricolor]